MQLPTEDKYSHTKEYLESTVTVMMGGRIAEETFLGHMTTGAGNDIERATDLARKMVCEWGMSEMGPLTFGRPEQEIFLGRDFGRTQDYSEATANQIDAEVKRIVTDAYDRAKKIIEDNQKAMHRLARTLLEKEVLDGDEVLQIIAEESGTDISKLRKSGPPEAADPARNPGGGRRRDGRPAGPRTGVAPDGVVRVGNRPHPCGRSRPPPRRCRNERRRDFSPGVRSRDGVHAARAGARSRRPLRLEAAREVAQSAASSPHMIGELPRWGMRFEKDNFTGRQRESAGPTRPPRTCWRASTRT